MRTNFRRTATGLAVASALALLASAPASAHIEPDVEKVQAGQEATVGFVVEHGCDGAATTRIEIKVPDDVTDFAAGTLDGWTSKVEGHVVSFEGNLPDHTELGFPVRFTAPSAATTLRFPIVQTCGDVEVSWLGESEEDEHPAPVVEVTGSATATTSATTAPGSTTSELVEPMGTTPPETTATTTTSEVAIPVGEDKGDDDSDPAVPIIIGGVVVLAVIGGGIAFARSRKGQGDGDDSAA
ncbi:MAG: DUF1775 domain-containing protein [Acidimicrobiales bacterium]|nr:DUF1775 domain-containing protein [Acidimicrobiales bacterium]